MSALVDYLSALNVRVAPAEEFAGILVQGSGAPGAATSPFFMFYRDTTSDDVYFNPTRASDGWEIMLAGSVLDSSEGRVKVTL